MPKAVTGERIKLNNAGASYIHQYYGEDGLWVTSGDEFVVTQHWAFKAVISLNGRDIVLTDSEYTLVTEAAPEPETPSAVLEVDMPVHLNERGQEVLRLLGKPMGSDIRVAGFLAGWVRLMAPEWEAPGHLFGRSEFEAVETPVEPEVDEVEVTEAIEVRAVEVRLHDVIWDGSAKAFTVERIAKYGDGGVVFSGYTGSGVYTDDTRALDEYVTLSGRRE